ncbi:MAG: hypothetical protein J6K39_01120 [Clostridia bacterium]|nr:hypothetical protein [Clostridia bacterium]
MGIFTKYGVSDLYFSQIYDLNCWMEKKSGALPRYTASEHGDKLFLFVANKDGSYHAITTAENVEDVQVVPEHFFGRVAYLQKLAEAYPELVDKMKKGPNTKLSKAQVEILERTINQLEALKKKDKERYVEEGMKKDQMTKLHPAENKGPVKE